MAVIPARRTAAWGVVLLFLTAPAGAVSITNRSDKEFRITVIGKEAQQDHVLKPAEVLKNVCARGCVVRLGGSESDEYELDGSEAVSIEDGNLYYDGPETPPPAGDSSGEAPPLP